MTNESLLIACERIRVIMTIKSLTVQRCYSRSGKFMVIAHQDQLRAAGVADAANGRAGSERLPLIVGLVALGGFVGIYFQPPGLQKLMAMLELQPGGGTSSPIAVQVAQRDP